MFKNWSTENGAKFKNQNLLWKLFLFWIFKKKKKAKGHEKTKSTVEKKKIICNWLD